MKEQSPFSEILALIDMMLAAAIIFMVVAMVAFAIFKRNAQKRRSKITDNIRLGVTLRYRNERGKKTRGYVVSINRSMQYCQVRTKIDNNLEIVDFDDVKMVETDAQ